MGEMPPIPEDILRASATPEGERHPETSAVRSSGSAAAITADTSANSFSAGADAFLMDIQQYFDERPFPGRALPFHLERVSYDEAALAIRPTANARIVEVADLQEEDLSNMDPEWSKGLREVGEKYGVELRLPSWYIER